MIRVGLIGARGYVGRELIAALDADPRYTLAYASSRAMDGRALGASPGLDGLTRFSGVVAEALSPQEAARREADVIVLGLPNGLTAPYVEAIGSAGNPALLLDLSADHRHREGWVYGSPELHSERIKGARRIANPGCYATAANLALAPLRELVEGPVSVFGVSGFSGAGTTPSPRNDPERLEANLLPYGFGGHGHEAEIARITGLAITFAPHVAPFFRGLLVTLTAKLKPGTGAEEVRERAEAFYSDAPRVTVQAGAPEIRSVQGRDGCVIGGFAVNRETGVLTFSSALDNLRKGAATQALENMDLCFGLT